jgi:hypothetical protein
MPFPPPPSTPPSVAATDAAAVPARLEWNLEAGGATCLDGPSLARAVEQRWKRRVFEPTRVPEIVVRGRIGPAPDAGWSARIELFDANGAALGSRELTTRAVECSALDDSVALAVGLMLDVTRHRVAEERAQHAVSAPDRSSLDGEAIDIPEGTAPARERLHFEPSASFEAAFGVLPELAPGFRPALALDFARWFRLEVAANFYASETAASALKGTTVSLWTVELRQCPLFESARRIGWAVCLVEQAGPLRARGFGFDTDANPREVFAAAGVSGELRFRLAGPLELLAGASVELPFVRYRFVYSTAAEGTLAVYRGAPIGGRAWLGVGARF